MKTFKLSILSLIFILLTGIVSAQDTNNVIEVMFVQNAEKADYKDGKLTLKDVGSTTLYFADRPNREFGHLTTADFVEGWGQGENSFADDPPNAVLSTFSDDGVSDAVLVLKKPVFSGNNLVYEVELLEGEIAPNENGCTLFIDPVGKPISPTSVAGVKRREDRRH